MRTRERIDPSQLDIKDNVVSINRVTKVVKGGKNSLRQTESHTKQNGQSSQCDGLR